MQRVLLDTSTLSELMKGIDISVLRQAERYLANHGQFTFSSLTRYEILRGLEAKRAKRQIERFNERCRASDILPLTDEIIVLASRIYGDLHRTGRLISDADILIAATAQYHGLMLVTENRKHFERIPGLQILSWRDG